MNLGDLATKARNLTNTDTTSYTDANLLIDLNIWLQKVGDMIYSAQDASDFDDQRRSDYPIQTTPLIAGQRDYSFGISEKVVKYKRVDVSWDGGSNYYRCEPMDDGYIPYGLGSDTQTDQNFDKFNPRYDVKYGAIWLYPLPTADDVTAGALLRVEWQRYMQPFTTSDYTSVLTDSTVTPGFDDAFHPILAYGAAFEYASSRNLPQLQLIVPQLQDWEARLKAAYGRKDLDTHMNLQADNINYY